MDVYSKKGKMTSQTLQIIELINQHSTSRTDSFLNRAPGDK